MNHHFEAGEHIRVSCIQGSEWQGRYGTIVEVITRGENAELQECAVNLDGDQRWFMAQHLIKTISPDLIRPFRNAAMDRWKLDPDKTVSLRGDWDELVEVLCEHCDFTIPRAQQEVARFFSEFERKLQASSKIDVADVPVLSRERIQQRRDKGAESQTAA